MRQRFLSARDGLRLAARDWDGPPDRTPVLCLSGIARSSLDFLELAALLSPTRRVVALDHAGHGDSAHAADPTRYAVDGALRDVLDAMAALHLHRAVVVGTSLGGIIGMALSVLRPGALAALVLNDIGPTLDDGGVESVRDFIGRDPGFATLDDAAEYLARTLPPLGFDAAGWRDMAARTYAAGSDGLLHPRWDTRLVTRMPQPDDPPLDLWPLFGGLAATPALLLHGSASAILSAATVARMRAAKPDLGVVTLPGIGHAPPLQGQAAAAIAEFVAGIA